MYSCTYTPLTFSILSLFSLFFFNEGKLGFGIYVVPPKGADWPPITRMTTHTHSLFSFLFSHKLSHKLRTSRAPNHARPSGCFHGA